MAFFSQDSVVPRMADRDPIRLVVMGVSGCGKSYLAAALAADLGLPLIEGDDYHPPANIAKMSAGVPLTDDDRAGWLATLGELLARADGGAVLTCSALKRAYRDCLRSAVPSLCFVFMEIDRVEAQRRVEGRAGRHFFPGNLIASQFETLEPPGGEAGVITVQATAPIEQLTAGVRNWLKGSVSERPPEPRGV